MVGDFFIKVVKGSIGEIHLNHVILAREIN